MSNSAIKEAPATSAQAKPKIEKVHSYLTVMSTAIGICGALGSLFVWLAANFYVGTVELKLDKPVESLVVKVYDREGHEATYHSKNFQLMPGSYHLEVMPANEKPQHFDTTINFGKRAEINVAVKGSVSEAVSTSTTEPNKRHWWQFWRRPKQEADQIPE